VIRRDGRGRKEYGEGKKVKKEDEI